MFAALHVSDDSVTTNDPNTDEGWIETDRMAHLANDFVHRGSARSDLETITGRAEEFQEMMSANGATGYGSGQKLG